MKFLLTFLLALSSLALLAQENFGSFAHSIEVSEDSITVFQQASFVFGSGGLGPRVATYIHTVSGDNIQLDLFYEVSGPSADFASWSHDTIKLPNELEQFQLIVRTYVFAYYDELIIQLDEADTTNYSFTTGLIERSNDPIKVYPNPSTSLFSIELPTLSPVHSVQLYNLSGAMVRNFERQLSNLETSSVPTGIYLLRVQTDSELFIRKVVVE